MITAEFQGIYPCFHSRATELDYCEDCPTCDLVGNQRWRTVSGSWNDTMYISTCIRHSKRVQRLNPCFLGSHLWFHSNLQVEPSSVQFATLLFPENMHCRKNSVANPSLNILHTLTWPWIYNNLQNYVKKHRCIPIRGQRSLENLTLFKHLSCASCTIISN